MRQIQSRKELRRRESGMTETKTETIQQTKPRFETFKPRCDLVTGFLDFLFHLLDGFIGFVSDEDILNVTEPGKRCDVIVVQ